jgi:hypothetical protein
MIITHPSLVEGAFRRILVTLTALPSYLLANLKMSLAILRRSTLTSAFRALSVILTFLTPSSDVARKYRGTPFSNKIALRGSLRLYSRRTRPFDVREVEWFVRVTSEFMAIGAGAA